MRAVDEQMLYKNRIVFEESVIDLHQHYQIQNTGVNYSM